MIPRFARAAVKTGTMGKGSVLGHEKDTDLACDRRSENGCSERVKWLASREPNRGAARCPWEHERGLTARLRRDQRMKPQMATAMNTMLPASAPNQARRGASHSRLQRQTARPC